MIVRDNQDIIRPCLESVRQLADQRVVVDTGSVDAAPQIACSLGAEVSHFPWCDSFAAARNESLRHATGDWGLWMDSDDTIDAVNAAKLRKHANHAHHHSHLAYVMQVHCPASPEHQGESMTVVDHTEAVETCTAGLGMFPQELEDRPDAGIQTRKDPPAAPVPIRSTQK